MAADVIPEFFVELGQVISDENLTYEVWYAKHPDKLKKIAEKYIC